MVTDNRSVGAAIGSGETAIRFAMTRDKSITADTEPARGDIASGETDIKSPPIDM